VRNKLFLYLHPLPSANVKLAPEDVVRELLVAHRCNLEAALTDCMDAATNFDYNGYSAKTILKLIMKAEEV